ncbi:MAG: SEC-C domain-containing protein, partial [Chloroflexota bacterium]|nr:SEC-C domain-containing protein [Chloroflexota bacterium]
EFTGRTMPGRRWSDGLHQAVEAKEGIKVQQEQKTIATITVQNYFRQYEKLAGMTGTALTEAEEFHKIYGLTVVMIPTHRPMVRADNPDVIYKTEKSKFEAVIDEVVEMNKLGRPVLVGTVSVEKSERLGKMLERRGLKHNVLNAKQHEREAAIVAEAGQPSAVTIATNMAGRGTDIVLGGAPEMYVDEILTEREIDPQFATEDDRAEALDEAKRRCAEDREKVLAAGGLYIIGTERHESRRIDNQLRGRSGRQGDPGESRFFVSLKDDLLRRFNADRVAGIMGKIGLDDDTPIESKTVTAMLEQAQTKVEGANFDIRKNVVEYDDVIAAQRAVVYADRRAILERANMHDRILEMIGSEANRRVAEQTRPSLAENWDLEALDKSLEPWGVAIPLDVLPDQINRLSRETLTEAVVDAARAKYEAKEQEVITAADQHHAVEKGDVYMRQFERAILLNVIDNLWRDHIDRLDVMRSGIGLRGLAQRDPLVEFKREGFLEFDRFKEAVERGVAELALRAPVQITLPPPPPPAHALPAHMRTNADAIAQAGDGGELEAAASGAHGRVSAAIAQAVAAGSTPHGSVPVAPQRPAASSGANPAPQQPRNGGANGKSSAHNGKGGANQQRGGGQRPHGGGPARSSASGVNPSAASGKIGRNDPCYCGSGKKYKQCHGR